METLSWISDQVLGLWRHLVAYYQALPYEDMALQIIATVILIIFVITILLTVTVILLRTKNSFKARTLHKLESGWDEQLMVIIFSEENIKQIHVKIKRRQRRAFLNYLYQYAQRLQGEELERIKALAAPYLGLIVKGVHKGYPELRARNVNVLGTFGFSDYLDVIREAVNDKSPIVSMTAAWSLAQPDYPEHCKLILPVLNKFDQWSMNFLSSMLAGMGPGAAPDLRVSLADVKQKARVRIACAEALGMLNDLPSADVTAKLIPQESDPELLASLLRLLGKVGVGMHGAVVRAHVTSDEYIVRLHALSTLGRLGTQEDGDLVRGLLEDKSNWVGLQAARTLLNLKRQDILHEAVASEQPYAELARQVLAEEQSA